MTSAVQKLRLYHTPFCGFCFRVRYAAQELGVELELVDTSKDADAHALLLSELGRGTVPVLGIISESGGERLLPESRDIIEYLKEFAASKN